MGDPIKYAGMKQADGQCSRVVLGMQTNSGLSIHTRGRQAAAAVFHHCLSRVVMEGHPSGMGKHHHQMQRAHTMMWSLKVQLACVFTQWSMVSNYG